MLKLLLILVGAAVLASAAVAQEPRADHTDDVARGLFEAGRASYDAGSYREALELFQQAYDNSQRPRLLYNIGQSADRMRLDRTALNAFRRYLELVPDADNKLEVDNRIRALEELVVDDPEPESPSRAQRVAPPRQSAPAQPTVANTPTVITDQPEPAITAGPGIAPWLVIGVGGAAVITGVVLFAVGTQKVNNVGEVPQWSEVRGDAESGPTFQNLGLASMVLGAVGTAVGIAWALTAESGRPTEVVVGLGNLTIRGSL